MDLSEIKVELYNKCVQLVDEKLDRLLTELDKIQASANEETKSSAGDKYETGRAMLMLEKEKISEQLSDVGKMKKNLDLIDPSLAVDSVQTGALVQTGKQAYFISTSLGMLSISDFQCFAISPVSPIAQEMMGKKSNDNFSFRGQSFHIASIV